MTRENKLALVVGFGLVLFVGILISDHYSEARRTESLDLSSTELLITRPFDSGADESLIEPKPALPDAPEEAVARPLDDGVRPPLEPAVTDTDQPEVLTLRPSPGTPPSPARIDVPAPVDRIYRVRANETLYRIARREYGNGNLWQKLAAYNGMTTPDRLREGDRIRLPRAATLGASSSGTGSSGAVIRPANYTVVDGDTLADIADKLLGSERRWPEIHALNRDRLKNPNVVVPGTVLRVPSARR